MDLLNRAGFHTAHLFHVAAHRKTSGLPNSTNLRDACLLEVHPLNVFWIPIARWQYWGAHLAVKAHFADLMKTYVPHAWLDFIGTIGVGTEQFCPLDPKFEYSYTEEDWNTKNRRFTVLRASTNIQTPQVRKIVSLIGQSGLKLFTEADLRRLLQQGKSNGEFDTKQDVMRVFNYYRKKLRDDGVLDY